MYTKRVLKFRIIVNVVTKWTNSTQDKETLIYPGESSIHWILKLLCNFKDMAKTLVPSYVFDYIWHTFSIIRFGYVCTILSFQYLIDIEITKP